MPSTVPTRSFARLSDVSVEIESLELVRHERAVSSGFTRVTTELRIHGRGETGVGEDVSYDPEDHEGLRPEDFAPDRLSGRRSFARLSALLDQVSLFPRPPVREASRQYRRWAVESAALDLALRQAGLSLADALGRVSRPVHFVVSTRLGEPPDLGPVVRLLERRPELRFKLDPTDGWSDSFVRRLAETVPVATLDLKGAYEGTPVDQAPDPVLYERVMRTFSRAWIEDPALRPETLPLISAHRERVTWDAPIHSVADILALPFPPRTLNFKPSRFGSVERLLDAYDHCAAEEIAIYGGGQFELGPGRGQIQYLASLFHADAPNDVAPRAYNEPDNLAAGDLPRSPLPPAPAASGFRWDEPAPPAG